MNLKSNILKITIIFALIFMLVPVIAAEDANDAAVADNGDDDTGVNEDLADDLENDEANDDIDEETDDEIYLEEDDVTAVGLDEEPADLAISIISNAKKVKAGDITTFGILVTNKGPATAHNVVINFKFFSGTLYPLVDHATKGLYDLSRGVWLIDELAPGEVQALLFSGIVLTNKDLLLIATVTSDNPDPDFSNNVAMLLIDNVDDNKISEEVSAGSETLPATGNPIMLVLLALISIAGACLGRRL